MASFDSPKGSAGSSGLPIGQVDPSQPAAVGYRTNMVTAFLCVWFTAGLFLDAWAHNNIPGLETFFTPWHAVFYSGFTATAGFIVWTVRDDLTDRRRWRRLPAGYPSAILAIVGFAVAGAGDYLWHTAFGIEQDIAILFSPTHLGLVTTMFVIVTTPLRSAWSDPLLPDDPGLRRLLPAIVGTVLATALVLLFAQYANALTYDSDGIVFALSNQDQQFTARLVASMAMTTLILVLPLLCLSRRWTLPPGSATLLYAAAGALSGAVTGFGNVRIILALLTAGLGVDVLARWLRPGRERRAATRSFAALTPAWTWFVLIAAARLTAVSDPPADHAGVALELYLGAPVVQGLIGLLAAELLLMDRPRNHADAA